MKKALLVVVAVLVAVPVGYVALSWAEDLPVAELAARYAYPDSRFIEVDGMDVHYRITGDGPGKQTLVLLHGTSSSLHTWEGWHSRMSDSLRVVSLDLPAFGITGPFPHGDYSGESYMQFLDHFFDALGLDTFHLAGNSFGGFLTWRYAVHSPGRMGRIILLNASGYPRDGQPTPLGLKLASKPWAKALVTKVTSKSLVGRTVKACYYDTGKVTDALVARYRDLLLREGNRAALVGRMTQVVHESQGAALIKQVACPTLILWGEHDRVVWVKDAPRFHADIPGSQLIIYPDLGHVPMEEDPARSAADALRFLTETVNADPS